MKLAKVAKEKCGNVAPTPEAPVAMSSSISGGDISIYWQADTNGVWYVQENHNLSNSNGWVDIDSPTVITNEILDFSTTPSNSPNFYRLIHRNP